MLITMAKPKAARAYRNDRPDSATNVGDLVAPPRLSPLRLGSVSSADRTPLRPRSIKPLFSLAPAAPIDDLEVTKQPTGAQWISRPRKAARLDAPNPRPMLKPVRVVLGTPIAEPRAPLPVARVSPAEVKAEVGKERTKDYSFRFKSVVFAASVVFGAALGSVLVLAQAIS